MLEVDLRLSKNSKQQYSNIPASQSQKKRIKYLNDFSQHAGKLNSGQIRMDFEKNSDTACRKY